MQGEKVSSLPSVSSSDVSGSDVFYIVNALSSRKISVSELATWLKQNGLVGSVNGRVGSVTLSASDVSLQNVPNVLPVTSITVSGVLLNGDIILKTANGLTVSTETVSGVPTLTIGVGTVTLPWGSMIGNINNQPDLISRLNAVGILNPPRYMSATATGSNYMPITGGTTNFIADDLNCLWVNIDCPVGVSANIPLNLAPTTAYIGKMLEVRHHNPIGTIHITKDSGVTLNSPYGSAYESTTTMGQVIQLICIGINSWEYR